MKRLCFVSVLMLLAASGASAQQYRTSYFMEGSTMRGYLNPALRPDRGYVYIPVLGTTSVNFNSNALTFKTIFYPVGDNGQLVSLLDDRVTWHDIEPNLKTMNKVGFDLHMTLLGAGFYTGRDFWTIEAGLDVTGGFYLPKSFVEFVKLGSKANAYDMGGLMAGADAVMNISAGYSRRINDELTVGGRVNFKGGLARANMNYDRLNVTLNGEKWAVDAGGNLALSLNGLDVPTDAEGYVDMDRLDAESFVSNIRGLAGFGLTFDIGAEYVWMERFKFSAAILNLGFMNWSENIRSWDVRRLRTTSWECATISIRRRISGRPSERAGISTSMSSPSSRRRPAGHGPKCIRASCWVPNTTFSATTCWVQVRCSPTGRTNIMPVPKWRCRRRYAPSSGSRLR